MRVPARIRDETAKYLVDSIHDGLALSSVGAQGDGIEGEVVGGGGGGVHAAALRSRERRREPSSCASQRCTNSRVQSQAIPRPTISSNAATRPPMASTISMSPLLTRRRRAAARSRKTIRRSGVLI